MDRNNSNVIVSPFDYSIENHFTTINTIRNLCGTQEEVAEAIDETELELLNSRITFLRQWRDYYYKPRVVRFGCGTDSHPGKNVIGEVNLPQFSSATVPKTEILSSETGFSETSNDFVLYVGGHIWALDWCPAVYQQPDCHIKCEYLAVAAHPPESSYHKIGATLTGRGVVQIWCVLHEVKQEEPPPTQRGKNGKQVQKNKDILPLKRRGRPRKKPLDEESLDEESLDEESLDEEFLDEESLDEESLDDEHLDDLFQEDQMVQPTAARLRSRKEEKPLPSKKARGRPRKKSLDKSYGENQMVQPAADQLCSEKEEKPLPSKKARGRPRKKNDRKESLGATSKDSFLQPPTAQLCIMKEALDDTNREMVQATEVQLSNVKDINPPLSKTTKGRSRKKKAYTDFLARLETECASVPALAVDVSHASSGYLALIEAPRTTEEHDLLESRDADVRLNDSNREKQLVQETSVHVYNVNAEKPPSLEKTRGKPKKQKGAKESVVDLVTTNMSVPAFAFHTSQVSSASCALNEDLRNTEKQVLLKSCETDVSLNDSNRENQISQATAVQLYNVKRKLSPLLTYARRKSGNQGPRKQRGTMELLVDSDTKNESVQTPSDVSRVPSGSLSMNKSTRSIEEDAPPKNSDADVVTEGEILDQCCYKKPMKKRKFKGKTTANHADAISKNGDRDSYVGFLQENKDSGQDTVNVANSGLLEVSTSSFDPSKDVALPRVVLCLAHNGKVAWDVKWKPTTVSDVGHGHRMGYLAVLLGNGSLEVWEVPSLKAIENLYFSCKKEGTDPRFVKLEPVFRCSKLKSGDRHSIPLTVEWSTSSPHDLLLAGCHDGTVALWKFSSSAPDQDTRPLLCFSADTLPIRALAWAPDESDEESANVVVTAGHGGVRFWDLRDPYRPLWDVTLRRFIYSLDWLQNPRCVIMSFDDGTLRILSLSKAAYDVPVTGKPFSGTQQQGLHSFPCLTFPIWSVQASRLTGQVVYCSSDGSVLHFQLTSKAVDKDPSRNRAPHFLCGSLTEDEDAVVVNTPIPNIPFQQKKSLTEWGDTPRSIRGLSGLNQAKKAIDRASDSEPLALFYTEEPSIDIGSEDMTPVSKSETTNKTNKKRKPDTGSAQAVDILNQGELRTEIEVFPSKIVAMHRVRWNPNKGSERWLCYGGAAGIIRCQEISAYSTPARLLLKN